MYKRGEDLRVVVGDVERSVEVKCRAAGFGQMYDWLRSRWWFCGCRWRRRL
jgi:hypothetical protein